MEASEAAGRLWMDRRTVKGPGTIWVSKNRDKVTWECIADSWFLGMLDWH